MFRHSARNFNPDVAMAGKVCIAEVEEIVPAGALDPNEIHLPDVYVKRVVKCENIEKRIEFKTISKPGDKVIIPGKGDSVLKRERIVRRCA